MRPATGPLQAHHNLPSRIVKERSDDVDDFDPNPPSMLTGSLEEIHFVQHAVLARIISILRYKDTPPAQFRRLLREATRIIGLEATRGLPLQPILNLRSPVASYDGWELQSRVALAPVLRSGIGMIEALLEILPDATTHYLGLFRDTTSLSPVEYFSKLPKNPDCDIVFILDPLVATGGTAIAAVNLLLDWGMPISKIKMLCVIASMPGLERLLRECPGLEVWCGACDQDLDEKGYVVPGLGDVGDRQFGTKPS